MPENLYCEPCHRLLCGEVSVISQSECHIVFNHHNDFKSFETAMQLPCAICSLAYVHFKQSPSALNWVNLLGQYIYVRGRHDERTLSFFPDGVDGYLKQSASLILVPLPGLSEYKTSYDLSSNTRSESATNFLLAKYHECRKMHEQCSLSMRSRPAAYPSRLLDVGSEEYGLITLRNTDMFCDEEYVCLSHCWGDTEPFALNAGTQSALVRGIAVTSLPKTFQDAIIVTRRLRIRYIWIDSLCIFQDNENDWATESAYMGDIYARAACTIAATGSTDSTGGLFFERFPQFLQPRRVHFNFNPNAPWLEDKDVGFTLVGTYLCDVQHLAGRYIEDAPLNSRAWVSQERQLSRRLLHFTSTQIFWECYECTACETYPERLPDWAKPLWQRDATLLKERLRDITNQDTDDTSTSSFSLVQAKTLDDKTYFAWGTYRYQYSRCALTHETDKLVAIRGIANQVSQATGDEFVAGFWRSRIIEELCWRTEVPTIGPTEWRAPTWSWASSNAAIQFSLLTKFHDGHASRNLEAEVIVLNVRTKASGELEDASMMVKCRLLQAIFTPAALLESLDDYLHGILQLVDHDGNALDCTLPTQVLDPKTWFSIDNNNNVGEPQHGYVVVIQQCLHEGEFEMAEDNDQRYTIEEAPDRDCLEALFLRARDDVGQKFERIGLIRFERFRAVRRVLEAHRMAEDTVITLI